MISRSKSIMKGRLKLMYKLCMKLMRLKRMTKIKKAIKIKLKISMKTRSKHKMKFMTKLLRLINKLMKRPITTKTLISKINKKLSNSNNTTLVQTMLSILKMLRILKHKPPNMMNKLNRSKLRQNSCSNDLESGDVMKLKYINVLFSIYIYVFSCR